MISAIAAAACILTVLLYITGLCGAAVMLPLVFLGIFACLFLCWALPCVIGCVFVDLDKPCTKHSRFFRFYADGIISSIKQLLRISVCVSGMERLPKEKFLLAGNHRSVLDPLLEMSVFREYRIGFVAKQELYKIPVICKIMHKCFCLPLNRSKPREAIKTITQAARTIQSQTASIGVYPEGTRSESDILLPFRSGAFKIAQRADCPVVVVIIRNSEKAAKRAPFRRTTVYIDVVGIISSDEVSRCKASQLGDTVRQMMESALAAFQAEHS